MSNNNGTGFWVVVGLGLVLIPLTIIEAMISLIGSCIPVGRRTRIAR